MDHHLVVLLVGLRRRMLAECPDRAGLGDRREGRTRRERRGEPQAGIPGGSNSVLDFGHKRDWFRHSGSSLLVILADADLDAGGNLLAKGSPGLRPSRWRGAAQDRSTAPPQSWRGRDVHRGVPSYRRDRRDLIERRARLAVRGRQEGEHPCAGRGGQDRRPLERPSWLRAAEGSGPSHRSHLPGLGSPDQRAAESPIPADLEPDAPEEP